MAGIPRTEFAQALKAIASERGLDADVILETIKQAIIAAYRRDARERGEETEELEFDVDLDSASGEARIYMIEDEEKKDVTPPGFGRIAAQTAKQVIHQKIREAEKGAIMDEFSDRVGTLISGMVLRFDGPDVRVDLGRAEGIMPASERVPNERLSLNQRYTFLMKDITETPRGKLIVLSRSDPQFVVKLFEREVPEMSSGSVEVKGIAREAGVRTKIAVHSTQSGVDPVGSCVGQKGVRVQAVTNELGGERVDIIPWNESKEELIKASLSPAEKLAVTLNEKEDGEKIATVQAPEDQLSLAIGKDGQNARLAAKLTGYKIEVESLGGEEEDDEKKESDVEVEEEKESEEKKEKEEKKKEKKEKKETKKEKKETKKEEAEEAEDDDEKKEEEDEAEVEKKKGKKKKDKEEEIDEKES